MTKKYLVTGGAGFIGSNYVDRLLTRGEDVTVYDNLSRGGAPRNLAWLRATHGADAFQLVQGDVRDASLLTATARGADILVHLASQVAVTTSVLHPREDFEINAIGTFNVLEAARLSGKNPIVLYASTNKVYGEMEDTPLIEKETRWEYAALPNGVPEMQPLDFHSPYGCSKGTGDQYVRDYHRIYGLPTVVFRQGCIYGPRQFGIEDQGWVAWFVIAAVMGKPITIFGDGKQVRDMLHVYDLLDGYDAAVERINSVAGQVYNMGGGYANTLSIWKEFGAMLEEFVGHPIPVTWKDWRPGDQRVNMNDTGKALRELGWQPKISVREGIRMLHKWVVENKHLFQ
ncbi:MAG: GDP-mannose 4,6-dehydratase [Anaerolineales bacterium]|nr:GDP-mannose 4,6-dehydratase [Anaerolineales bacterium]